MIYHLVNICILVLLLTGCSLFKRKGTWGQNSLWPVQKSKVREAFIKNITLPHFIVPLAGAGVSHWGGYDEKISNWAVKEESIYQQHKKADRWSNILNEILKYEMFFTPLLTPSSSEDDSFKQYSLNKAKGYGVIALASRGPDLSHEQVIKLAQRRRPNGSDRNSFPSGHAIQAGTRNNIVSRNLDSIPMNNFLKTGIKTVNTTMAIGVMWARVEGKRHFPSDVLAGYALGSFLSGFIYDSLINYDHENPETLTIVPLGKDKLLFQYTYAF